MQTLRDKKGFDLLAFRFFVDLLFRIQVNVLGRVIYKS